MFRVYGVLGTCSISSESGVRFQALEFYVYGLCSGPAAERRSYIESIQYLSTLHTHEGSRSTKAGESHVLAKPSTHLHVMNISMFKDAFGKKREA